MKYIKTFEETRRIKKDDADKEIPKKVIILAHFMVNLLKSHGLDAKYNGVEKFERDVEIFSDDGKIIDYEKVKEYLNTIYYLNIGKKGERYKYGCLIYTVSNNFVEIFLDHHNVPFCKYIEDVTVNMFDSCFFEAKDNKIDKYIEFLKSDKFENDWQIEKNVNKYNL